MSPGLGVTCSTYEFFQIACQFGPRVPVLFSSKSDIGNLRPPLRYGEPNIFSPHLFQRDFPFQGREAEELALQRPVERKRGFEKRVRGELGWLRSVQNGRDDVGREKVQPDQAGLRRPFSD
jgi:hypothetical protein